MDSTSFMRFIFDDDMDVKGIYVIWDIEDIYVIMLFA